MVGWLVGWLGGRWYVVIKFTCITVVVVVVLKLMLDDSVFWVPFALMVLMMFWAARFFFFSSNFTPPLWLVSTIVRLNPNQRSSFSASSVEVSSIFDPLSSFSTETLLHHRLTTANGIFFLSFINLGCRKIRAFSD